MEMETMEGKRGRKAEGLRNGGRILFRNYGKVIGMILRLSGSIRTIGQTIQNILSGRLWSMQNQIL